MLLRLVIEDAKKVCRYIPTEEEILTFLHGLAVEPQKDFVPPIHIEDSVPSIRVPTAQDSKPKRPLQWTKLVVTMPDGEIVECSKIKDTFVEVIEKLGVEKVAALDIIRRKIPRVSASEYPGRTQRQSGSYYIYTGGSTNEKRYDLLKIAKGLGIELKVEILPKE